MKTKATRNIIGIAGMAASILIGSMAALPAQAADEAAARELARANNCFKCHAIDKEKDGPAWNDVAKKYKGKADAKEKLLFNVTKEPLVKLEDGTEQKHKLIDTTNKKELDNLFEFILSRQ